ncbi:MAG: hypothetical protein Q4C60_03545 [Eubacteriales bacterium]|nr:hypothetical protein [Eubacteriales bacterium]
MNQIDDLLTPGLTFTKTDFSNWIREDNPQYSERSIYWLLNKLQAQKEIIKLGRNLFQVVSDSIVKRPYNYNASIEMKQIEQQIQEEYPRINFQTWEFIQMNEFVNHQIAHNVLFIEVESMLEETVFELLKKNYPGVLLCPSVDTFHQYKISDNTIVILRLISQAPKAMQNSHSACLEKILVDLFSRKLTGQLIQRAEYPTILEDAFSKYYIDERKMFRYARRRDVEREMLDLIYKETSVQLITKGVS